MNAKSANLIPAIVCALIVGALMLFPGDVPWGGDDILLVNNAIQADIKHQLIKAGLGGSFGYPYGPLPSQIYQALALLTHDPVKIAFLHAGLFAALTAASLLWLTRVMRISPWFAPMTMVGPFYWFYCRLMWDNTFAMPVGVLLLAAYCEYLQRKSRIAFFTTVSCAIALLLIHPMTLPLVLAVAIHAMWSRLPSMKINWGEPSAADFAYKPPKPAPVRLTQYWRGLLIISIVTAIVSGPYFLRIAQQFGHSAALLPPRSDALSRADALAFPLFSGRLFTAYGFFDERGPEIGWEQNQIVRAARLFSLVAYPLIWLGMVIAIWSLKKGSLPGICLLALMLQSAMDAYLRISPYPHYFCGTWAAAVVLLWLGIESLQILRLRILVAILYTGALCVSTAAFAIDIHQHAGGQVWYGSTLKSQQQNSR